MSWFDRWLLKRLDKARMLEDQNCGTQLVSVSENNLETDLSTTVRFQITPARGGSVVTVTRYDQRRDTNDRAVYVIEEDSDLAKRVSEIITIEMYRS